MWSTGFWPSSARRRGRTAGELARDRRTFAADGDDPVHRVARVGGAGDARANAIDGRCSNAHDARRAASRKRVRRRSRARQGHRRSGPPSARSHPSLSPSTDHETRVLAARRGTRKRRASADVKAAFRDGETHAELPLEQHQHELASSAHTYRHGAEVACDPTSWQDPHDPVTIDLGLFRSPLKNGRAS